MNPCIFLVAVSIYCSGLVQSSHAKPNATNSTFLFSGTNQTADDTNSFDGHLMRNAQHDNYQFTKWPNGIVPYAFDYTTLSIIFLLLEKLNFNSFYHEIWLFKIKMKSISSRML